MRSEKFEEDQEEDKELANINEKSMKKLRERTTGKKEKDKKMTKKIGEECILKEKKKKKKKKEKKKNLEGEGVKKKKIKKIEERVGK